MMVNHTRKYFMPTMLALYISSEPVELFAADGTVTQNSVFMHDLLPLGAVVMMLSLFVYLLVSNRRLKASLRNATHQRIEAELALATDHDRMEKRVMERTSALRQLSFYDPLTELPNRTLLYERLAHAANRTHPPEHAFALLIIDLDRFKAINNTLGHYIGDHILAEVANRLKRAVPEADTIAYLGGDEFAILQWLGDDMPAPTDVANAIHEALQLPFITHGLPLDINASIGIAYYPDHAEDADNLLRYTEIAMYTAKRDQSEYAIYDHSQQQHTQHHLVLAGELRHALLNEELVIHYQPKVATASGQVTGYEALVRWEHPTEGLLLPDRFIPLAEQTGLIRPLTQWTLNAVLRQIVDWRLAGKYVPVAINLSVLNLQDPHFPEQLAQLLEAWEVPPDAIELEVTETATMLDPERSVGMLEKIDQMGIPITVDDFGTGHSSMAYLKQLPMSTLKIDKSFILDMEKNLDDTMIVRAIVELGHNLGLKVVAEGVESAATLAKLQEIGCDIIQGFHVAAAMPSSHIEAWFAGHASAKAG